MNEVKIGAVAPDFTLPAVGGGMVTLSAATGKKVVLFFYSRDNTAGCTSEAREFAELYPEFAAAGCVVYGVSRDSLASHERFSAKLGLPYLLLSDDGGRVCGLYGVIKEKTMYGKKVFGVERSTFIIDESGRVSHAFRGVKAAGHAAVVLAAVKG